MNRLRHLLDQLTLYLPVLLMGMLALATYWLVRSTPPLEAPHAAAPARHLPDYFMRQFSVTTFDALGQLKNEITGLEARHFPDADTIEIDQVHVRSFNEQGQLTTAQARLAVTNSKASEIKLHGQALVERQAGRTASGKEQPALAFRGEFLHAFIDAERVTSDQPVELSHGLDRFTANSMDYDHKKRIMLLTGNVQGRIMPGSTP